MKSKAQARMMFARAKGGKKGRRGKGPSEEVAKQFVAESGGQDLSRLREYALPKRK